MTPTNENSHPDHGPPEQSSHLPTAADDQIIISTSERAICGRWVSGTVGNHEFSAKVYPSHALHPSFELRDSRISKLEVYRCCDHALVAAFERGWYLPPVTPASQQVVDTLSASLANRVFPGLAESASQNQPQSEQQVVQEWHAETRLHVRHKHNTQQTLDF